MTQTETQEFRVNKTKSYIESFVAKYFTSYQREFRIYSFHKIFINSIKKNCKNYAFIILFNENLTHFSTEFFERLSENSN